MRVASASSWRGWRPGVDAARRVVHASGRARKDACLSRHCGCPFSHDFGRPFPFEQVRLTSIYSTGDGVAHWQCQLIPDADCIEVTGSHIGLVFSRRVYRAAAGALALPELPPGYVHRNLEP